MTLYLYLFVYLKKKCFFTAHVQSTGDGIKTTETFQESQGAFENVVLTPNNISGKTFRH